MNVFYGRFTWQRNFYFHHPTQILSKNLENNIFYFKNDTENIWPHIQSSNKSVFYYIAHLMETSKIIIKKCFLPERTIK